jgi:hypothetical protein
MGRPSQRSAPGDSTEGCACESADAPEEQNHRSSRLTGEPWPPGVFPGASGCQGSPVSLGRSLPLLSRHRAWREVIFRHQDEGGTLSHS